MSVGGDTIWVDDPQFPERAAEAVADAQLRRNLQRATSTIRERRSRIVEELPDWQELRSAGAAIKDDVLLHLDGYLEQFEAAASVAGPRCTGRAMPTRRTGSWRR